MGWIAVACGSAAGGVARYGMTLAIARLTGPLFPFGTILINVLGSYVIAAFAGLTMPGGKWAAAAEWRLFVMVGICGGFTTFSSFSLQTLDLLRQGRTGLALANIAASVLLCLAAAAAGYATVASSQ